MSSSSAYAENAMNKAFPFKKRIGILYSKKDVLTMLIYQESTKCRAQSLSRKSGEFALR